MHLRPEDFQGVSSTETSPSKAQSPSIRNNLPKET